tara:strand:- start:21916 stop:23703 length:1788 start_codon:yes stop_codon:yes gene_type:complete
MVSIYMLGVRLNNMCGILGAISKDLDDSTFYNALKSIDHRGPDNIGELIDSNLKLGHSRLAIIDLSKEANQPYKDNEKDIYIIFNGEIYNYIQLKQILPPNETYHTNSEVEVMIKLYKKFGISFINYLDGMFSFSLYDKEQKRLILARDRLGEKPLFYHIDNRLKNFYFSSELKSFKYFPIKLSLDTRILDNILNFTFYEGESLIQEISSLSPGQFMTVDLTTFRIDVNYYFELTELINKNKYNQLMQSGIDSSAKKLTNILTKSIQKRHISDVPISIIASGGLDSSLIAYISRNISKNLNLLHIDSVTNSEKKEAILLAKELRANINIEEIDINKFKLILNKAINYWDNPLVHANAIGIFALSQLANTNGYKVIIGGEGADELFGGYPHHRLYKYSLLINRIFKFLPDVFLKSLVFARAQSKTSNWFPTVQHLLNNERYQKYYNAYQFLHNKYEREMASFLATELEEYLIPLLSRADRMTMANGVEMRLPFLDLEVVEFALNCPVKYKINLFQQKIILRHIGKKLLPNQILDKKKVGFTFDFAEELMKNCDQNQFIYLQKYMPIDKVINSLKRTKSFHKILRLYSIDKICSLLL